jgi:hypothetical protein
LIPQGALLGNIASAQDPYQRKVAPGDIGQAISSRIPGLREQLPTRLSGTAQPLPNPQQGPGILIPRATQINPDPVLMAYADAGKTITGAPTTVSAGQGTQIKLTPDEQRAYEMAKGQQLDKLASTMVQTPFWQTLPKYQQQARLDAIETAATQYADGAILRSIAPADLRARLTYTKGPQSNVQGFLPEGFTAPESEQFSNSSGLTALDQLRALAGAA